VTGTEWMAIVVTEVGESESHHWMYRLEYGAIKSSSTSSSSTAGTSIERDGDHSDGTPSCPDIGWSLTLLGSIQLVSSMRVAPLVISTSSLHLIVFAEWISLHGYYRFHSYSAVNGNLVSQWYLPKCHQISRLIHWYNEWIIAVPCPIFTQGVHPGANDSYLMRASLNVGHSNETDDKKSSDTKYRRVWRLFGCPFWTVLRLKIPTLKLKKWFPFHHCDTATTAKSDMAHPSSRPSSYNRTMVWNGETKVSIWSTPTPTTLLVDEIVTTSDDVIRWSQVSEQHQQLRTDTDVSLPPQMVWPPLYDGRLLIRRDWRLNRPLAPSYLMLPLQRDNHFTTAPIGSCWRLCAAHDTHPAVSSLDCDDMRGPALARSFRILNIPDLVEARRSYGFDGYAQAYFYTHPHWVTLPERTPTVNEDENIKKSEQFVAMFVSASIESHSLVLQRWQAPASYATTITPPPPVTRPMDGRTPKITWQALQQLHVHCGAECVFPLPPLPSLAQSPTARHTTRSSAKRSRSSDRSVKARQWHIMHMTVAQHQRQRNVDSHGMNGGEVIVVLGDQSITAADNASTVVYIMFIDVIEWELRGTWSLSIGSQSHPLLSLLTHQPASLYHRQRLVTWLVANTTLNMPSPIVAMIAQYAQLI
jgi:hypothetical protein